MDHNKEYHDPDYPEPASCVKEEPPSVSEEEKIEKIKSIIRREFSNELEAREEEVMLIDQRMSTARRLLHQLRYKVVSRYYSDQKLQLGNGQIQDEIAAQRDPRARTEVASLLTGQRQLHPSVRKLLGKQSVDIDEIFRTRGPRNKTRKDYVAMLQKRNYTISADATKTLRPGVEPEPEPEPCSSAPAAPKKVPRHFEPKITNVVTLVEPTRNKVKNRYRIIIGNTSKYVPAASRLDRSTHKWLLYVRAGAGGGGGGEVSRVVTGVTVTLHHSYAPHHRVHLDKPPYHISRRGWGEFPAKVELHFPLPERNRPAAVTHTIKLDRNYTGVQMLGSETVVDVWLYSTPEMLPYEYKEEETPTSTQTPEQTDMPEIKTENTEQSDDNWMDFFTKGPTELDVDEMIIKPVKKEPIEEIIEQTDLEINTEADLQIKTENPEQKPEEVNELDNILKVPNEIFNKPPSIKKRIVKYIDPTTGKIYYLEMDRELDLTKVQEIIINNTTAKISPIRSNGLKNVRKKKGISLLKPEVKSLLKSENNKVDKPKVNIAHIENDHCYIATPKDPVNVASVEVKKEASLFDNLCSVMHRFCNVRPAVNYLVKNVPLISENARDVDYLQHFPFTVENIEKYWKLDFAKRRNIEWSRAKLINRILTDHFRGAESIWRTKQILLYLRMHGHHPVRTDAPPLQQEDNEWSSWNDVEALRRLEGDIKENYPRAEDISTMSVFNMELDNSITDTYEVSDDEDIDIVGSAPPAARGGGAAGPRPARAALPAARGDRPRFVFVEATCRDIGIELTNEDVGDEYSYSAVHAVILSAMKSFAEELIRSALAEKRRREMPRDNTSLWTGWPSTRSTVSLCEVYSATERSPRLRLVTSRDIAARPKRTCAI